MPRKLLADRVQGLTPSATVSLPDKARALKNEGVEVIDLSEGQPRFDTPKPIKRAAKEALDSGMVFYIQSRGLPELLSEIRTKLEQDSGIDVPTSQIIVTVGAKHAVANAILCTINPGDEVLIPDPYWGTHAALVTLSGGIPVSVPMLPEDDFRIDISKLNELVNPKSKMIILNSPHNPTGMVISREDMESIADICIKDEILAMSDEIYEKMVYDGAKHYSIGSFPGMEDLAITVNGFSKTYSMTGLRLGYVAANKEIIGKMLIVQQHSVTHPAAFVEKAGIVGLRDCEKYVRDMVKDYQRARDFFVPELSKLGIFKCDEPRGAFYAFPKIVKESMDSGKICDFLLEKARVLAVPGSGFGNYGEGYVRFVYAQQMDTLKKTIDRIKSAVQ